MIFPILFIALNFVGTLDAVKDETLFSTLSTSTERKVQQSQKYLKANLFQHKHNYPRALRLYNELLIDDASPYVYDGYLRLLSQMNHFPAIVSLIDKTKDLFKDNIEIQLIYAQSLINTNRNNQAVNFLKNLQKQHPDNAHIAYYLAAQHEKNNKIKRAHQQVTQFLTKHKNHPRRFLFLFFLSKLLFKMGNIDGAIKAVNKSLRLYPSFDQGLLFKAFLLEKTKRINDAIECYKRAITVIAQNNKLRKHSPQNNDLKKHLVQLLLTQKRYNEAVDAFKQIDNNSSPEYLYNLAIIESKARKYNEAIKTIDRVLKKNRSHKKAQFLKAEILITLNQKKEALEIIKNIIVQSPHDNSIVAALISLSSKGLSFKDISAVLATVEKKYPNRVNIMVAQADLFLQKQKYQQAIECYKRALTKVTDATLRSKLQYQVSFVYFSMGKKREAEYQIEQALKQKTIYPSTFNLAAQILTEGSKNLEKAHIHINRALKINKNSPYFLDTQGTIFYKQKKYNDAITSFEKALKYAPNDPIIRKHLEDAQRYGKK